MWLFIHSLVVYITNFVLVLSVRSLVRRFSSKDFYPYCAEVLSSFLMVANTHENGNVYGQYGIGLYSVCLFTLMMAYPGVCDCLANPIVVFDRWWNKKISLADSVLKIMAQVTGALLAARYMTWLWKTVALSEYQVARGKYLSLTCDSANKVSIPEAMMVELIAASVLRVFASCSVGGRYYERYFNSLATIFVILAGLKEIGKLLFQKEYHHYVCEFCCCFIVVANVYENGNIITEYGVLSFAVTLFALILIYMYVFDASASPISIFDEVWNKKRPVTDGVLTMVFQVAGACLGARFIVYLWGSLQLTDQHISKAEFLSQTCHSTNQVTILEGFAVEMLFTMILRIIASYSSGVWLERSLNSFASVAVVVIGLDWTGSMINPALATAMTYNCENHPFYEHVLVYWIAPFTGSVLSDYIEDYLHGPGWRDKDQVSPEEQQGVKTNRRKKTKRKSSRSKKSSWDQTVLSVNNVSPKKRKQKEANNNSNSQQRKVNVGGN